jgi:membrane protein insertase Oxa1/YidC/SpoIIIJ
VTEGGPAKQQSYEQFFRYIALLVFAVGAIALTALVLIYFFWS